MAAIVDAPNEGKTIKRSIKDYRAAKRARPSSLRSEIEAIRMARTKTEFSILNSKFRGVGFLRAYLLLVS